MKKHTLTDRQKKFLAAGAMAVLAVFSAAVFWFVGRPMIRFARQPELFRQWVAQHGVWGKLAYVGMMVLQVLVAVIPGEPLEMCGGYAFGALWGTLLCLAGATLGSLLVFALVRRWGTALVEVFFSREKLQSLSFLHSSPKRDVIFWLIFTVPGTPKDLLCYFAGLTDLPWGKWILICTIGRIPSVITSTVGGHALGGQHYLFAAVTFAATMAVSGAGLLIYRAVLRRHNKNRQPEEPPLSSDGGQA
ncbi:MAG: TVP38/TMEM64 family protein [Oscillospiraceae bacterium]|nr:TVP38/TMEM64 family protein [Oscillospiraceae bacterium]